LGSFVKWRRATIVALVFIMANKYTDILDLIHQLESSGGKDKRAKVSNWAGALGEYQLTPVAFKDLQDKLPEKWRGYTFAEVALDSKLAREAAGDYVNLITNYLLNYGIAPTRDAVLAAYHSGAKTVAKGKLGPEGLRYLERARALTGSPPEETAGGD